MLKLVARAFLLGVLGFALQPSHLESPAGRSFARSLGVSGAYAAVLKFEKQYGNKRSIAAFEKRARIDIVAAEKNVRIFEKSVHNVVAVAKVLSKDASHTGAVVAEIRASQAQIGAALR